MRFHSSLFSTSSRHFSACTEEMDRTRTDPTGQNVKLSENSTSNMMLKTMQIFIIYIFIVYKNCAELYKAGKRKSGIYSIDPDNTGAFDVYCDQTTAGGGWTVFQKRLDGSVDFYRGWDAYKRLWKSEWWVLARTGQDLSPDKRTKQAPCGSWRDDWKNSLCWIRLFWCCKWEK